MKQFIVIASIYIGFMAIAFVVGAVAVYRQRKRHIGHNQKYNPNYPSGYCEYKTYRSSLYKSTDEV